MTRPDDPLEIDERERPLAVRPELPQGVVWRLLRERAQAGGAAAEETRRRVEEHRRLLEQLAKDVADVLHGLHGLDVPHPLDGRDGPDRTGGRHGPGQPHGPDGRDGPDGRSGPDDPHDTAAAGAAAALPSLTRRLAQALAAAGARYLDPAGAPYEDVAGWADVEGSEPVDGLERPVVAETLRPGVLMADGKLAQRARVYLAVPVTAAERQEEEQ